MINDFVPIGYKNKVGAQQEFIQTSRNMVRVGI